MNSSSLGDATLPGFAQPTRSKKERGIKKQADKKIERDDYSYYIERGDAVVSN